MWTMAGKSPLSANEEQRRVLADLGRPRDRGEADRARAVLLALAGWTSPAIAVAFGGREDTVRLWRSAFMAGGVEGLRARVPQNGRGWWRERGVVSGVAGLLKKKTQY